MVILKEDIDYPYMCVALSKALCDKLRPVARTATRPYRVIYNFYFLLSTSCLLQLLFTFSCKQMVSRSLSIADVEWSLNYLG